MNTRSTKIIFIISIALIVIAIVGYVWLFKVVRDINYSIAQQESQLALEKGGENRVNSMKRLLSDTQADRKELHNFFIGKDGIADFANSVEKIASDLGLEIDINLVDLDKTAKVDSVNFENLKISLETRGSWSANILFLSRLQLLPYRIVIQKTVLDKSEEKNDASKEKSLANLKKFWRQNIDFVVIKNK